MGVYHNGYKMLGNNIVDPGSLLGKKPKKRQKMTKTPIDWSEKARNLDENDQLSHMREHLSTACTLLYFHD